MRLAIHTTGKLTSLDTSFEGKPETALTEKFKENQHWYLMGVYLIFLKIEQDFRYL